MKRRQDSTPWASQPQPRTSKKGSSTARFPRGDKRPSRSAPGETPSREHLFRQILSRELPEFVPVDLPREGPASSASNPPPAGRRAIGRRSRRSPVVHLGAQRSPVAPTRGSKCQQAPVKPSDFSRSAIELVSLRRVGVVSRVAFSTGLLASCRVRGYERRRHE